MDDLLGSVVLSLSGRDKGDCFIVISTEGNDFVRYSDGRTRPVTLPKKKKLKHIKILGKSSVTDISAVTNKQLREAIAAFTAAQSATAPEKEE